MILNFKLVNYVLTLDAFEKIRLCKKSYFCITYCNQGMYVCTFNFFCHFPLPDNVGIITVMISVSLEPLLVLPTLSCITYRISVATSLFTVHLNNMLFYVCAIYDDEYYLGTFIDLIDLYGVKWKKIAWEGKNNI